MNLSIMIELQRQIYRNYLKLLFKRGSTFYNDICNWIFGCQEKVSGNLFRAHRKRTKREKPSIVSFFLVVKEV